MFYRAIVRTSRLILLLLVIASMPVALASTPELSVDIEGDWVRLDDRSDAFHLLLDTANYEVFLFEGGGDGYRFWGSVDIADEIRRIRRALIDQFEVAPTPESVAASIEGLPAEQRTVVERLFDAALGYGGDSVTVQGNARAGMAPISYGRSTLGNRLTSYGCELVEVRNGGGVEGEICVSSSSRDPLAFREKRNFLVALLMAAQLQAHLDEQSPYMHELDKLSRLGLVPLLTGQIELPDCQPATASTPTRACLRTSRSGWGD